MATTDARSSRGVAANDSGANRGSRQASTNNSSATRGNNGTRSTSSTRGSSRSTIGSGRSAATSRRSSTRAATATADSPGSSSHSRRSTTERRQSRTTESSAPARHLASNSRTTASPRSATRSASGRPRPAKSRKSRLNKPLRVTLLVLGCIVVFLAALVVTDVIANYGRIHRGVSVAGVDVGGLTESEAATLLDSELSQRIAAQTLDLSPQHSLAWLLADLGKPVVTVLLDNNLQDASGQCVDPLTATDWQVTSMTLGASVDGEALAAEAYQIGRSPNFFFERLKAWASGIKLPATLNYDETQFTGLVQLFDRVIGTPIINADITFTNGSFEVIPARAGSGIDQVALVQQLNAAFLGNDQTVFLTLATLPAAINDTAAQALADQCNQAIAQPVTMLGDQGENWSLTSDIMGPWLETHIQSDDQGTQLLATVSPDKLKASLGQVVGDYDPGVPATNASFQIVDNAVTIIPSQDGLGIDYPKLSTDLQAILFGPAGADRTITIAVSDLPPNLSTSGAEALHITDKISTFSTYYGFSTEARATNVQVASGYANNTLIAPGTVFSFLNTVGDATIARGFVSSKVISGGEYVDAIGGGVCQVATTVYNAVYDAGYPIVARSAHGLYQSQYPAGRDAAVYYPWLDMQWKNDTENWILLTVTCSQGYVTASLWGTDPGYVVKSEVSAWQPGEKYETQRVDDPTLVVGTEKVKQAGLDGRSITVTRRVYDAAGNLLRESVFKSTYGSVPEIIQVGTAPAPPPPPPPPPSNNNGSSTGDNNGSTGGQDSGGTDSSGDSTGGTGSQ